MVEQNPGSLDELLTTPTADEQAASLAAAIKGSGFWVDLWRSMIYTVIHTLLILVELVGRVWQRLLTGLALFYRTSQGEGTPAFYDLTAAIIEDLLGIPIESQGMIDAHTKRGRVAAMQQVGEQLYNNLQAEFTDGGPLSEEQGLKGAKGFLGFLMSFAVRQGNVSVISEIATLHYAKEFREYGEMMSKNLGLGRQARMALRPLVNTLIATPLQWNINRQYRPTKLSEALFVSALNQGVIDEATFQTEMARLGYSDAYIKIIKDANARKLSEAEIIKLLFQSGIDEPDAIARFKRLGIDEALAHTIINVARPELPDSDAMRLFIAGKMDEGSLKINLRAHGYTDGQMSFIIESAKLSAADSEMRSYVTQIVDLAKNHDIDLEAFKSELQSTTLTEEEQKWITRRVGVFLEQPQKYASLAQMEGFFSDGLIDLDDFRTWLEREGYGLDDRQRFVQALFLKMDKAKQPKPKKKLSLSELRKAYKGSEITIDQFKSGAAALGYADDSIDIFLSEISGA